MIISQFDNTCIVCGAVIPESYQVCPICGATESTLFEACKPTPIAEPQTEFKVDDQYEQSFREGYIKGFEEGMKAACELKQQNAQLRKDNAILRAAIERRDNENNLDGWYE